MKSNHYLMTLAAVLCCAMTTTIFTACNSDDDNDNNHTKDAPATAEMECEIYTTPETIESFDFYLTYYDENGKEKTEKIVWAGNVNDDGYQTWTKRLSTKLPATLGAFCEIKAKPETDLEGQYYITSGYQIGFRSRSASGKIINEYNPVPYGSKNHNKKGMLEDALNQYGKFLNFIYKYDSNGIGLGASKWANK